MTATSPKPGIEEEPMRKWIGGAVALALAASSVLAGEIYGTLTEGGKSVGAGVEVAARCGERDYPAMKTDKAGAYRVVVEEKGKCTLTVHHKGQAATIEVASYAEGVQVDLVLELQNGKYVLKRK
jgi:hypothetical protein